MFDHALDVMATEGLSYDKSRIISRTVEFIPLTVPLSLIHICDMVYVEKGGEIIPKITGVELSQRPADSRPFEYIAVCHECGTPLVKYEGEAKHYCPNQGGCRPQIIGRIIHFIRRKAMRCV